MRKSSYILALFPFLLFSCVESSSSSSSSQTEAVTFTVTFDSNGGSAVLPQEVEEGSKAARPGNPDKEGYSFDYWYLTAETSEFDFNTPIQADITLIAKWSAIELTYLEKINQDIADARTNMILSASELSLPKKGKINNSTITWASTDRYISKNGIVLPIPDSETDQTGEIKGTFSLGDKSVTETFEIPLSYSEDVILATTRSVPFSNMTTEYEVPDGNVNLYFEENGSVPYIKLLDFFSLTEGFIDPEIEFRISKGADFLTMAYDYYDEEEDHTYNLELTVNAAEDTISTNDPGFYWAYVYSTETNYGRNIEYLNDHPDSDYVEGHDVVYNLSDYFMDIVVYDGDIVLPYYMVNQIFAGSSYYNVYYNYDKLVGIYALPESGTQEYRAMKTSTKNNKPIPADLLVHTFNMLAFNMDNFYGLKDVMNVDTYYDVLYPQVNQLLTKNAEDFEVALRDFLLKAIDEPHTSYGNPSYFTKYSYAGAPTNDLKFYGSRFTKWYYDGLVDVDKAIGAKWGKPASGWSANASTRPLYWYLDSETVSVALDGFDTADIEESGASDWSLAAKVLQTETQLLPSIEGGSKYFYYNSSDSKNKKLEILVKGLTAGSVADIKSSLESFGYTYHFEASTDAAKANGYFSMTSGDVSYMVQIAYDEYFKAFYLGIMDKAPASYQVAWPFTVDVKNSVLSDSAVYLEFVFDKILGETPALKNVLLDLSWNTGGNVGALYRVMGFITDQPFSVSHINRDTGSRSTNYVGISVSSVTTGLKWALLTTAVTFSAANSLTTIFRENNLGKIIGRTSGGGACSITPILLPTGSSFTMSSNNLNAYRTGSGTDEDPWVYVPNEFGIAPDIEIPVTGIYDTALVMQVFA